MKFELTIDKWHLVEEDGYPEDGSQVTVIWKYSDGEFLWDTCAYDEEDHKFTDCFGGSLDEENVVAWSEESELVAKEHNSETGEFTMTESTVMKLTQKRLEEAYRAGDISQSQYDREKKIRRSLALFKAAFGNAIKFDENRMITAINWAECQKSVQVPYGIGGVNPYATSIEGAPYKGLQAVEICFPETVVSIKPHAMEYVALDRVSLPRSLKRIEPLAFSNCVIREINIPESVKEIGYAAFSHCNFLEEIDIPDSVESIGHSAFECCGELKSVKIAAGVTEIGSNVFKNCDSVNKAEIDISPKSCEIYYNSDIFIGFPVEADIYIRNIETDLVIHCKNEVRQIKNAIYDLFPHHKFYDDEYSDIWNDDDGDL